MIRSRAVAFELEMVRRSLIRLTKMLDDGLPVNVVRDETLLLVESAIRLNWKLVTETPELLEPIQRAEQEEV